MITETTGDEDFDPRDYYQKEQTGDDDFDPAEWENFPEEI